MTSPLHGLETGFKQAARQYGWLAAPATGLLHLRYLLDPNAKLRALYGEVFTGYLALQNVVSTLHHERENTESVQLIGQMNQLENGALAGLFYHAGKESIHIVYAFPSDPFANQAVLKGDLETTGKTLDSVDYTSHAFPIAHPTTVDSLVTVSIEKTHEEKLKFTTLVLGNPKTFPKGVPVLPEEYKSLMRNGLVIKKHPIKSVMEVPLDSDVLGNRHALLMLQDFDRAKKLTRFATSIATWSPEKDQELI